MLSFNAFQGNTMIRAVHTNPEGRKLLILGIDKTNVERIKAGQPILVKGDQMGLDLPIDVAILYGESLDDVAKSLRDMGFVSIPDPLPPPVKVTDA